MHTSSAPWYCIQGVDPKIGGRWRLLHSAWCCWTTAGLQESLFQKLRLWKPLPLWLWTCAPSCWKAPLYAVLISQTKKQSHRYTPDSRSKTASSNRWCFPWPFQVSGWWLWMLRSGWTFDSTWVGRLRPSLFARCARSFCLRYSVRALGLWQYGWYVVTEVWEISQAYEGFQGSLSGVLRK